MIYLSQLFMCITPRLTQYESAYWDRGGQGVVVSLGKISVQVVLISFKMQQSMFMPPLNHFSLQISSEKQNTVLQLAEFFY